MNSFFPRAIRLWNELPTEIKDALVDIYAREEFLHLMDSSRPKQSAQFQ